MKKEPLLDMNACLCNLFREGLTFKFMYLPIPTDFIYIYFTKASKK